MARISQDRLIIGNYIIELIVMKNDVEFRSENFERMERKSITKLFRFVT